MRAAPIGGLNCNNLDKLKEDSRIDAIITHNNEEAVAGSRAVNYFVARGVCQNGLKDAPPALIDECVKFIGACKVAEQLKLAKKLLVEEVAASFGLLEAGDVYFAFVIELVGE